MPINANSFMLVNASPEKIAQLDAALAYLQKYSPNMAAPMLAEAAESQVRIVFSDPDINNRGDGYGEGQHSIVWDPTSGLVVLDRPNGTPVGVESAANGLFHEIAHSLEIDQRARNEPGSNDQYDTSSEATATIYANAVAKDCGEPERPDYRSAKEILVSNVTEHTEVGENGSSVWAHDNSVGRSEFGPQFQPNAAAPSYGTHGNAPWEGSGGFGDYGGGGGDGGNGSESCVHVNSYLPDGTRAGQIVVGSHMQLADQSTLEKGDGQVTYSEKKQAAGFRIETSSGASLVCSDTAPIPTKSAGLTKPAQLLGKYVAVRWDEAGREFASWEEVVKVEPVGTICVQHITVGDKCFWAGEKLGAYILHHNVKADEWDPLTAGRDHQDALIVGVVPPTNHVPLM